MNSILLISLALISSFLPKQQDTAEPVIHNMTQDFVNKHLQNQASRENSVLIRAIVDLSASNEKKGVIRLYMPDFPKWGGVEWKDIPEIRVAQALSECQSQGKTLWVVLDCRISPFSAPYGINPQVDPGAIVSESNLIRFETSEKVTLPDPISWAAGRSSEYSKNGFLPFSEEEQK